jgi:diacylglycerol kinase family enzyme
LERFMASAPKVVSVIMNEGSGSHDSHKFRGEIQHAFEQHDVRVTILPLTGAPSPHRVEGWVRSAEGLIVTAGGDGTINLVASACRRVGRPFGIIPGGTFNYVARNLGLPADVAEAARVIAQGTPQPVAAGEINGHLFLNNAGFGLYSHMIEQRELDKQRFGRNRVVAFVSGMRMLAHRHPLYHLRFEADGREQTLRTTTLFFGVNALQLENYNVEAAQCVKRGSLAVLSLRIDSRLDIAEAALAALRGKTEAADSVGATCAQSVRVTTRRRKLKVAVDGEIFVMKPPLTVHYVPDALQIVLPPTDSVAAGAEPDNATRAESKTPAATPPA